MTQRLVIDDLSGGRNGYDTPTALADNECIDAVNVDWYRTRFARKRDGSSHLSLTSFTATGIISFMGRFVPGVDNSSALMFTFDGDDFQYYTGSGWSSVVTTVTPPNAGNNFPIYGVSYNGKYFLTFPSAANRLHVYDPVSAKIRLTGLTQPSAPSVVNTGSGSYAATLRYYRVRYMVSSRYSEASASTAFTPSGTGTAARILKPVTTGEDETNWVIEASTDNVTFYQIAAPLVSASTYDDSAAPGSYTSSPVSPLTGTFRLQKSYRFIAADQNRILGFGSWDSSEKQNRIEISAVFGSRDQGDDERVDTTSTYYYDLDENDSGRATALMGPVFGNYYAFKSRQMWELAPTGSVSDPYRLTAITKELGCIDGKAVTVGEDPDGNPCLYFLSHRGVYRYGTGGLMLMSHGIEDLLLGTTSMLYAQAGYSVGVMLYYGDRRQLWCWVAVANVDVPNGSDQPSALLILNVLTGGWSRYTGEIEGVRTATMYNASGSGLTAFSLVPYASHPGDVAIMKCADTTVTADNGTAYRSYVTTRPVEPQRGFNATLEEAIVRGPVATGVTLTANVIPNFDTTYQKVGTALMTATNTETYAERRLTNTDTSGAQLYTYQIGDAAAVSNRWKIDRLIVPWRVDEDY